MQIGKKAALMAATAGAMVIGSAAGASAYGVGGLLGSDGVRQSNSCDITTGAITNTGAVATSGELDLSPDCINFTNSRAAVQSNDCDTTVGPIANTGAASPSGDLDLGAHCTNIAIADAPTVVVKQVEKKDKHKVVKKEKKAKKKHAKKKSHGHH